MESVLPYVLAIVPTVGVGTLFYFVIKSILEGDRRERLAQAQWEAQHDRRASTARQSASAAPGTPDAADTADTADTAGSPSSPSAP
ncbi:hypothetical protein GCM10009868_09860 [Terrabacter aerolatus]|uniref:Uncharacterized protein n=1 Tax=Terrabacter aerolatus TaxID=422442 RepID=A0A512D543_9MICO|nr:hypothetical protein [Terrabacter aerolatus]GEO31593.1 hypothetical protein TAE01_34030 [Terrabacter aerolatus]